MLKEKSSTNKFIDVLKALYPFIVWQALSIVAVMAASFLIDILTGSVDKVTEYVKDNVLMLSVVGYVLTLPIFIVIAYFRTKWAQKDGTYEKYKSVNGAKYLFILPLAFFGMYAGNILVSLIEKVLPESLQHSYDDVASMIYGSNFVVQIIAAAVLGPIIEELCFRYFLYGSLRKAFGIIPAAIATGVVFGITHGNLAQFLYAFLLSMLFVFVYEKYKTIAAPIIAHCFSNFVGILISNFASSGSQEQAAKVASNNSIAVAASLFVLGFSVAVIAIMVYVINRFVKPSKI